MRSQWEDSQNSPGKRLWVIGLRQRQQRFLANRIIKTWTDSIERDWGKQEELRVTPRFLT